MPTALPQGALKGFVGIALGALNVAVAVWVGVRFGWVDLGATHYLWAVGGTAFVLAVKILIGGLIGKDFTWSGNSHDSCVMAFGACMPTLVISMAFARSDLGMWAAFTALTFVCLLVTGKAYQVLHSQESSGALGFSEALLISLSLLVGFGNLGLYTLLAVEKVQQAGALK